jgi:hypothetical protein
MSNTPGPLAASTRAFFRASAVFALGGLTLACTSLKPSRDEPLEGQTEDDASMHPMAGDADGAPSSGPPDSDAGRVPTPDAAADAGNGDNDSAVDAAEPEPCTDECSAGEKRCGPNGGTQECVRPDACTAWADELACASGHGTASCAEGVCVASCNDGYENCEPAASDCETPIDSDLDNCGGCGLGCLPNSSCVDELCRTQLGYPVVDCGAGLQSYSDVLFGFAIDVPAQSMLVSFGAVPQTDGTWNFALYTDVDGKPERLVAQSGDRELIAYGGAFEFAVGPVPLDAGTYWLMAISHLATPPRLCVSLTSDPIALWQSAGIAAAPPDPFPPASDTTYVTYQRTWNVHITLRTPGM